MNSNTKYHQNTYFKNINKNINNHHLIDIYKDFQFQTIYYGDSATKFYASKNKTYFLFLFIIGFIHLITEFYFNNINTFKIWIRIVMSFIFIYTYYRKVRIRYQSILIIFGIGIQLETGYLFGTSKIFVDKSKIFSTIIYDKMTYMELVPCIGIVIKDEKSLIIPFSQFRIPMDKNILIYNTFKKL